MRTSRRSRLAGGFTLVEMLVVMAIIAALAALLLPAISRGKLNAQRVSCTSNLKQVGLAYHNFVNDHGGKFPMQVSTRDGGIAESLVGNWCCTNLILPLQALSNELVNPKILICPSDSYVTPATSFAQLLHPSWKARSSYYANFRLTIKDVGLSSSILTGDRNLVYARNLYSPVTGRLYFGLPDLPLFALEWNDELHRFKGNLLFADGHVDCLKNGRILISAITRNRRASNSASLAQNSATPPAFGATGSAPRVNMPSDAKAKSSPPSSPSPKLASAVTSSPRSPRPMLQNGSEPPTAKPPAPKVFTNVPAQSASEVPTEGTTLGVFDARVVEIAPKVMLRSYLLLWLLLLIYLAYKIWQWELRRRKRRT